MQGGYFGGPSRQPVIAVAGEFCGLGIGLNGRLIPTTESVNQ